MKKNVSHKHLPANDRLSAWKCSPNKPRIDNIVRDIKLVTCKECLRAALPLQVQA